MPAVRCHACFIAQLIILGSLLHSAYIGALADTVFGGDFGSTATEGVRVRAVTWNVAAVNQNPFEYWITHPNPSYRKLMEDVERFIIDPGSEDVRVDEVFTSSMFDRVVQKMTSAGIDPAQIESVKNMWQSNYRSRKVVSGFLRDPEIGSKRLASMPDRVTNTIQLASGESAFRPAVINCYSGQLASLDDWFEKWLSYFFDTTVDLGKGARAVHSLLQKIPRAKYPAVTAEEEEASIPLQILLQGIFDSVLFTLMQNKSGGNWQSLRQEICVSLNNRKNERLLEILKATYSSADVVFLQEVGNKLVSLIKEHLADSFEVVIPKSYSTKRGQNSIILLRTGVFQDTEEVQVSPKGWDDGDLLIIKTSRAGTPLTLASFHGDTNGLLTMPMLAEVHEALPTERLIFGMDANTYEKVSQKTAHVLEFEKMYEKLGYQSCWGAVDPKRYTTFNARTYLQPQLNKAAKSTELAEKGDRNPKDFVLFTHHFAGGRVWRDNTGRGEYLNDMVFPTLEFPSDHAALSVDLMMKRDDSSEL